MAQRGRKSAAGLAIVPIRREQSAPIRPPPPPPPEHLSDAMKQWWREVMQKYELDFHHQLLLQAAAESWDRIQGARAILAREGVSFVDRFKNVRKRPEVQIESDNKLIFARLLRDLALDFPASERDPGGLGWRRSTR